MSTDKSVVALQDTDDTYYSYKKKIRNNDLFNLGKDDDVVPNKLTAIAM